MATPTPIFTASLEPDGGERVDGVDIDADDEGLDAPEEMVPEGDGVVDVDDRELDEVREEVLNVLEALEALEAVAVAEIPTVMYGAAFPGMLTTISVAF